MKVKVTKPTVKSQREALLKARAASAHKKWLQNKAYQYDPASGLFSTYEKTDSWVYKKENYLAEKLQKKLEMLREIEDIRIEMEHQRKVENRLAEGRDRLAKTKDDAKLSAIKEFVTVRESLQMATTLQEVEKVHEQLLPRRIQSQHTQHTTNLISTSSSTSPSSTQPTPVLQKLLLNRPHTITTSTPNSAASLETTISPAAHTSELSIAAINENRTPIENSSSLSVTNMPEIDRTKDSRVGIAAGGEKTSKVNLLANSKKLSTTSAPASPVRSQQPAGTKSNLKVTVKQDNKTILEIQRHNPSAIEKIENKLFKRGYLEQHNQNSGQSNMPVTDSLQGTKQALQNERERLHALLTRIAAGRRRDRDRVLEQVQQHHNHPLSNQRSVQKQNCDSSSPAKKNTPSNAQIEFTRKLVKKTNIDSEKGKLNEPLNGHRIRKTNTRASKSAETHVQNEQNDFRAFGIQMPSIKAEIASAAEARPSSSSSALSACSSTSCAEFPILRHSLLTESDLPRLPPDTRFDDFFLIDDEYRGKEKQDQSAYEEGGKEGSDEEALDSLAKEGDGEYEVLYDEDFLDDCDGPAALEATDSAHDRDDGEFSYDGNRLQSSPEHQKEVNETWSRGNSGGSQSSKREVLNNIGDLDRCSASFTTFNNLNFNKDDATETNEEQGRNCNDNKQIRTADAPAEQNQDLEDDLNYEQDFDDAIDVNAAVENEVTQAQTQVYKTDESIHKQDKEMATLQPTQNRGSADLPCPCSPIGTDTTSQSNKKTRSHSSSCKSQSSKNEATTSSAPADDFVKSSSGHGPTKHNQSVRVELPGSNQGINSTGECKSNATASDLSSRQQFQSRALVPISSVQAVLLSARESIRFNELNSGVAQDLVTSSPANQSSSDSSSGSTHNAAAGNGGAPSTNSSTNITSIAPAIVGGYLPSLRPAADRPAISNRRLLNKSQITNTSLPAN